MPMHGGNSSLIVAAACGVGMEFDLSVGRACMTIHRTDGRCDLSGGDTARKTNGWDADVGDPEEPLGNAWLTCTIKDVVA